MHTSLDADLDKQKYWNFSHHEYGTMDIPAILKQIVSESESCMKVTYVGYSLGSLQIFSGLV